MVWSMDRRDAVRPTYLGLLLAAATTDTKSETGFAAYYKTKLENTNSKMLQLKQIAVAVAHT